ncbi:glycosyltransferase family 2 protein [Pantoea sp. 18069]|uniref:glycosyltransferase family 2 protein n=1 Tax=Pantoea sp. 18069 TaxID=2681415 RepID=UPI00190F0F77|nr:hypothetical protein [Pantoea sp. 18069]
MSSRVGVNSSLVVSVVSHGHGKMVRSLLQEIAQASAGVVTRVVLTINIPEQPVCSFDGEWPFLLELRCNAHPLGFGANHNAALLGATEDFLCVLNPDVGLQGADPFAALMHAAKDGNEACAYPIQVDEQGRIQDSERALPTPLALLRRRVLGQPEARVDWVNAACLMFPRRLWQAVRGFDTSYHMYCEDVDLCLRIRLAGFTLEKAPCTLLHSGSRASHRKWSHLRWHVGSLLRLWASPAYKAYKKTLYARA